MVPYEDGGALLYPTRTQLAPSIGSQPSKVLYGGYVDAGTDPDMLTIDAAGDLWLWAGGMARVPSRDRVKLGPGFEELLQS